MELTLPKGTLAGALGPVVKIIERRNTIPVLSHVRMSVEGDDLEIRATDLDMEVVRTVPAPGGVEGGTCLPGRLLHDVVRKFEDSDVRFQSNGGHGRSVFSGASRFHLMGLPVADYPVLTPTDDGGVSTMFRTSVGALLSLLQATASSMSTDETRYYLRGVYLHVEDGRLRAVATDGHRLALASVEAPAGTEGMKPVILPAKAVGVVTETFKGASFDAEVEVECTSTWFRVRHGASTLTTKAIDGTYPDYRRVIPRDNPHAVVVPKDVLSAAVDRVATVVAQSSRSRTVAFAFGDDVITLTSSDVDQGGGNEEIDATVPTGIRGYKVGFNPRYLGEILETVHSGDVVLHVDQGTPERPAPVMIVPPDVEEGTPDCLVLMPVRL